MEGWRFSFVKEEGGAGLFETFVREAGGKRMILREEGGQTFVTSPSISGLRTIKAQKEEIQLQSQRLIFFQYTAYCCIEFQFLNEFKSTTTTLGVGRIGNRCCTQIDQRLFKAHKTGSHDTILSQLLL